MAEINGNGSQIFAPKPMKPFPWILAALAPLSAAALLAQSATPVPPQSPAQSQSDGSTAKPGAFSEAHVPGLPAIAGVRDTLNVRGQPAFKGEVVAQLHKGDTAVVLESLVLRKPRQDEPRNWARITLPSNTPVWVFSEFIDPSSMTILPKKVNLRGGPGENYSVLGHLDKGAAIKEVARRDGWIQIQTPALAYGFVDADYLEIPPNPSPALALVESPPAPVPTAETVAVPPVAAPPPKAPEPAQPAAIVAPEPTAIVAPEPTAGGDAVSPPASKSAARVISREGVLRRTHNIQAPADYVLRDPESGEVIDYVQQQPKQELKRYVGTRVMISGSEVLDRRWPRTPILEVQTLDRAP
jgi:hypothetical protein